LLPVLLPSCCNPASFLAFVTPWLNLRYTAT
jgi:hypothetical protein